MLSEIFAMITFEDIIHWMPLISAIILVAFDWGIVIQKLKNLTTKEDVTKMIKEELGHCPNTLPLRSMDLKIQAIEKWKEEHIHWGEVENSKNHLQLQEIRLNLKNICEKLGVKYHNGTKY